MLIDKSVRALLSDFSAPTPTPGGGSAAALAGALGASLVIMIARLPKKTRSDVDAARLAEAAAALDLLRGRLLDLVDLDSAAFDEVLAAYRQPKGTPDERTRRDAAIQRALRQAIDVPLDTMRACRRAVLLAAEVAPIANRSAASDLDVGIDLLMTALRGARLNVETNLDSLEAGGPSDAIRAEVGTLAHGAERDAERASEQLHG